MELLKREYYDLVARRPRDCLTVLEWQFLMERPRLFNSSESWYEAESRFYTEIRINRLRELIDPR